MKRESVFHLMYAVTGVLIIVAITASICNLAVKPNINYVKSDELAEKYSWVNDDTNLWEKLNGVFSDRNTDEKSPTQILTNFELIVNINTAGIDELCMLPGIGESLASEIIRYREENGEFSKVEDIMNVSGIGEKKFEELRNLISVS